MLWVRCHVQRAHAAVTLFLLICSPRGSSQEYTVGRDVFSRQKEQDCHWYAREQMLPLSVVSPQPCSEGAGREAKNCVVVVKMLLILRPRCSGTLLPCTSAVCLLLGGSQEGRFPVSCPFPRGASAALAGLGAGQTNSNR